MYASKKKKNNEAEKDGQAVRQEKRNKSLCGQWLGHRMMKKKMLISEEEQEL